VLLDQLQSEQGARFLMKRNRNIIIQVDDNLPVYENFIWLTLGHVKELLRYDNLVNMDTRTVLSGISYGDLDAEAIRLLQFFINGMGVRKESPALMMSAMQSSGSLNTINDIIHFLTKIKSKYDLIIDKISLWDAKSWVVSDDAISREDGKFFKVIGVNVSISNREVLSWQQPMVQPSHEGICGFVCKTINGVIHFAVQAKLECGNRDIIELAPTVQCLTGDYRAADSHPVPFLEYLLNAPEYSILYDAFQSEEGGRFFCEQNRNLIVMAGDDFPIDLPDNFIWMTLSQLIFFNQFNNYLNIQARSLIAAISLI
jgi:oxidase EvaA